MLSSAWDVSNFYENFWEAQARIYQKIIINLLNFVQRPDGWDFQLGQAHHRPSTVQRSDPFQIALRITQT